METSLSFFAGNRPCRILLRPILRKDSLGLLTFLPSRTWHIKMRGRPTPWLSTSLNKGSISPHTSVSTIERRRGSRNEIHGASTPTELEAFFCYLCSFRRPRDSLPILQGESFRASKSYSKQHILVGKIRNRSQCMLTEEEKNSTLKRLFAFSCRPSLRILNWKTEAC